MLNNIEKILIVDDEQDALLYFSNALKPKYQVYPASDVEEGLKIAKAQNPDVILIDINLPKVNGITMCKALRDHEMTKSIPVIMVSGMDDEDSRTQCFLNGADDFLAKPFGCNELRARIESKIKRFKEMKGSDQLLRCGNLVFDGSRFEVKINDQIRVLSSLEMSLLKFFLTNQNKILKREKILEAVWADCVVSERTVDTHIANLRKKLDGFDRSIRTIYGAGYILKNNDA